MSGTELLKKHKKAFISLLAVVCIILTVVSVNEKYKPTILNNAIGFIITPIQSFFTNTGNWISEKINFVINMAEIEDENVDLKRLVDELSAENSRLKTIDYENERLTQLLDISRKYSNYPKVGANVVSVGSGNWYNNFIIDKGSRDGFEKDMVVLGAGGLIGKIYEVGYSYSKVRSIIDDTSSVAAKSERTNDTGYLRGDSQLMIKGQCRMEFIDPTSEMEVDDLIITSHLSATYPPGIIIGKVLSVNIDYSGTKYALVEPFVDFKHLESVLVITQVYEREFIENESDIQTETTN